MKPMNRVAWLIVAAALLASTGCIELTGQRISWFYDEAADRLVLLVHYDGIHDSGRMAPGAEQIPAFVENGDIMFADWFGQIRMADFRKQAEDPAAELGAREWARLWLTAKTEPLGWYVEPDGRVGAAQRVTIPNARRFVERLNRLVNQQLLTIERPSDARPDDTQGRILAAARAEHAWLALEGHRFRVKVPVDPAEWPGLRAAGVRESSAWIARLYDQSDPNQAQRGRMLLTWLATTPWSYADEEDRVVVTLGHRGRTSTLRLPLREEYKAGMEEVVAKAVKTNLDQALAATLLDEKAEPHGAAGDVLRFGPPEEAVRALVHAAADESKRPVAIERLEAWAAEWNRLGRQPKAPDPLDSAEVYLSSWKAWYGRMKVFPVE